MKGVFLHIPIDIVEIIIVFSRCPKTFEKTASFINKLQQKDIQERIIYKLSTKIKHSNSDISFRYKENTHSSYDRPSMISNNVMHWKQMGEFKRNRFLCDSVSINCRYIYINDNIQIAVQIYSNNYYIYDLLENNRIIFAIYLNGIRESPLDGRFGCIHNILK